MNKARLRIALSAIAAIILAAGTVELPSQTPALNWYKGNLHSHTINSDGDSAPDTVARWYKERRYHFLALTDHNYLTDPQGLNDFLAASDRFLLLAGEEVTSRHGEAPVHVNAFRLRRTIEPAFGTSVLNTLQANVDRILEAGAVPSLNHPSYRWAIRPDVFRSVQRLKFFEVFNGSPGTNDEWELETMWDGALSDGREVYGIAVDDAHQFKRFAPDLANPGSGWVEVLAPQLTEDAILAALDQGDFYSSTGVKLESLERGGGRIDIRVAAGGDEQYRTTFTGKDGRVLREVTGLQASYSLGGGEPYMRATVVDSGGRRAWIQPVFAE